MVSEYVYEFNLVWILWAFVLLVQRVTCFICTCQRFSYALIGLFTITSIGFLYSCDYVFNKVLEPHQQIRIKVVLGMEEDLSGAGYNVNQSKIAIGSGGLTGKGFSEWNSDKTKSMYPNKIPILFFVR